MRNTLSATDLATICFAIESEGRPTDGLRADPLENVIESAVSIGAFDDVAAARAFVAWALRTDGERQVRRTSCLDRYDLRKIAVAAAWEGVPPTAPDDGCSGAYALNLAERYVQLGAYRCTEDAFRFFEQALNARLSPDDDRAMFGNPPTKRGGAA